MESYRTKDLTLAIFRQILSEEEFRGTADVGIVIQCYLKDAGHDLMMLRDWARERQTPVWVRLVKGAYWDYETVHATAAGWPIPVFGQKWETDANFERQSRFVLRNSGYLRPALASHNVRSLAHGMAVARHIGLPQTGLELQMLYGMADGEKQVFVDLGYRLRIYMPYGELIPGMAYLVRRLLENTSNDSFLRASFTENVAVEKLLMNPNQHPPHHDGSGQPQPHAASPPPATTCDLSQRAGRRFRAGNQPPGDAAGTHRRAWPVRPLVSPGHRRRDGRHRRTSGFDQSLASPGDRRPDRLGRRGRSGSRRGRRPSGLARLGCPASRPRPSFCGGRPEPCGRRRFELAAWEVLECGKGWREADADVCEAIDFAEYYADSAERLLGPQGVDLPGEENRFEYMPRGVAAVIAPWNFPLAILTGMTTAALVTGNTVVMKPAEQSPVIAAKLMEIFGEVGLAAGRVELSAGPGRDRRRPIGRASRRGPDRLHRLAVGRSGDQRPGGASPGQRRGRRQARHRRDGWQERDHHRRRRRPGRGGDGGRSPAPSAIRDRNARPVRA